VRNLEGADSPVDVVVFALGGLRFALAASGIDELAHAFLLERLPGAPRAVAGVANLRGQVVPVFDLRVCFGLQTKAVEPDDHFVVARAGTRRVILHVDRALDFQSLGVLPISEAPELPGRTALVAGVAPVEDGILFVYDLGALLTEAEARELDRALEARAAGPVS
jgi:purine-binding chemotaxis protein CheW